jgi:hypothetical protein
LRKGKNLTNDGFMVKGIRVTDAMKKFLPPLTWLRSFEGAARHLSFTAAAEELGLTQSAISQQIRSLEAGTVVQIHPAALSSTEGYFLAHNESSDLAAAFSGWLTELSGISL